MPIVQMPDGTNVQFPDDMPREQIRDMIASKFPEVAAPASDAPPPGAQPGTREYADWAAARAQGGHELPQVSDPRYTEPQSSILDPLAQGLTFGWGDEMRGAVQGGLSAMQGGDFEDTYKRTVDESRNALDRERRVNPWGSLAAEVAGAIPTGMGLGGQLAGRGATLGARALSGLGVGAAQGAAYGAGASEDDKRLTGAAVGGTLGGVIGGAAPYVGSMARRMVSPAPASASQTAAARTMQNEGITLTAGQRTGSKKLQYLESELGGGAADAIMERQAEQLTQAVLRRIGVNGNRATPDVVDAAYDAIGQRFDNLAAITNTPFDNRLQNNLLQVAADYMDTAGNPAPIVERMVNRLGDLARANGGRVTGPIYQEVRSTLGRLSKNADPATRGALRELQEALDDGVERHLSGQTLQAWQDARRAYRNFLVVERAVTSAGQNAAAGLITPAQLRSAAINQNRRAFARGANDFSELANAAVQTMTPLPQSGTAPRATVQAIKGALPFVGAAVGGGGTLGMGALAGAAAGALAPAAVGRAMLSRPGRAAIANQWAAGPQAGVVENLLRGSAPAIAGRRD
jgi:hypothetical protein